jgi:hypothetical protein
MTCRASARRLVRGLLALALLAGCAHRAPVPQFAVSGVPTRAEQADTPFFAQERFHCGPAALATVLNVRGVAVAPEALASEVYLPARAGSLQLELVAAARRRGLLAVEVGDSLEALLREVAAGHPVLVLQNLGLDWLPRWHYAVVIGYDLDTGQLILRSGTERRLLTPFAVFKKTWDRAARWGLVVLAPGTLPAQALPGPTLRAASDLEALGKHPEARAAFAAATRAWPEQPLAWLGLGNAEYALGNTPSAEAAFRRALRTDPRTAAAWNNVAHVLAARGCAGAARAAARCAGRLLPGQADVVQTEAAMRALDDSLAEACLPLPACPDP